MAERHPIGEFDLLAYADDPHVLDPQHREAIETHLHRHPEDAARVEIFRQQNAALRESYEPYRRAPVPERLYDALETEQDRPRLRVLRHAAAASVVAAAAVLGWLAGGGHGGPAFIAFTDEPQAVRHANPEPDMGTPFAVAGTDAANDTVVSPDLAHLGFSLIATDPLPGAPQAVRLSYAGDDGRRFTLLLRSRWNDRDPGFQVHTEGDVAIVSWEEGDVAAELTSRIDRDEALEIAEAVRASLRSFAPMRPVPNDAATVAVGSADPVAPLDSEAAAVPQQIR